MAKIGTDFCIQDANSTLSFQYSGFDCENSKGTQDNIILKNDQIYSRTVDLASFDAETYGNVMLSETTKWHFLMTCVLLWLISS